MVKETQIAMKPMLAVVEDNGGGLTLYIFSDAERTKVYWSHTGYQTGAPGDLLNDIKALKDGANPLTDWDGCDEDPQASWDAWGKYDYGSKTIADEDGPIAEEEMGAAGRRAFYPA